MGESLAALLLVCRQWRSVAISNPRLWSRIAVTNYDRPAIRLQGAVICHNVDYLRLVLSRSQASPLQIEFGYNVDSTSVDGTSSSQPSTLRYWRQVYENREEAMSLIFDNEVLRRWTNIILGSFATFLTCDGWQRRVKNMTILPLLSSLDIKTDSDDRGRHYIQSLINVSPSLRHIRGSNRGRGPDHLGAGMWTRRIESYGWLHYNKPCHLLRESPSLRELGIVYRPAVALTLPALQVLRWRLFTYSELPLITAPQLHTLITSYASSKERFLASSITLPNLRVAVHTQIPDLVILHRFQAPALEHLSIQSETQEPTALSKLYDGSAHMPTPKSLHLECAFTDEALLVVLDRLPWLEELQIAGTLIKDAFWKGFTTSDKSEYQVCLPQSHPGDHANHILAPNLKNLLINYSTYIMYASPTHHTRGWGRWTRQRLAALAWVSSHLSYGEEYTVKQASAAVAAREQAGCPLETLACFLPGQTVKVLIGNPYTLPQRPK